MKLDAAAFRSELEQRLDIRAAGDEAALQLDRERVVADRLLARLVRIAPGRWSVTGPFALDLKFNHCSRLARPIEIEWRVDRYEGFQEIPVLLQGENLGDHFQFRLERSGMGMIGRRVFSNFTAHASLAGEPFASVEIALHLRYGEISTEPVHGYDILGFAGIEPDEFSAVLLELRVAEMLQCYAASADDELGLTQAQNLVDLYEVGSRTHFQALSLRDAIDAIFDLSGSGERPLGLPRPGGSAGVSEADAETFYEVAERAGTPTDLDAALDAVAALFDPILVGKVTVGVWDAHRQAWEPGHNGNHRFS